MKRSLDGVELESVIMANYLMLLSQGRKASFPSSFDAMNISHERVFECKTCNRQFPSFQALGGHRASHKKPRVMGGSDEEMETRSPTKPKTHECSICGVEFAIGQALGGHMRRHRGCLNDQNLQAPRTSAREQAPPVVVKKSNSNGRGSCLDLNLTPYENDLEFARLGDKATPAIDCSFGSRR